MNICLGTAQLGLQYGIRNTRGKPDRQVAEAILDTAWELGIREFDTAALYGNSETLLNGWIENRKLSEDIHITTKLPELPDLPESALIAWMIVNSQERLATLGLNVVDTILLHRASDINRPGVVEGLKAMVREGLCKYSGISTYMPQEAAFIMDEGLSAVQITYSILDRRFEASGFLDHAKSGHIRVYARSPFLQGLLLMEPDDLPAHMGFAREKLINWRQGVAELGLDPLTAAIGFSIMESRIDAVVLGVDSPNQLREIYRAAQKPIPRAMLQQLATCLEPVDNQLILPYLWNK